MLIFACSDYNQVIKGDDYKRKFELADELYNDKQFARTIVLYEQIYQRMPKTGEGELAYFRIGKSYYEEGDYYMAGYYLGAFMTLMLKLRSSPTSSVYQPGTNNRPYSLRPYNRFCALSWFPSRKQ